MVLAFAGDSTMTRFLIISLSFKPQATSLKLQASSLKSGFNPKNLRLVACSLRPDTIGILFQLINKTAH
jgi:hypothetical protein